MHLFALLSLSAVVGAFAADHSFPPQARHLNHALARRQEYQSFSNMKWSWYDGETGNAGACGTMLNNADFFVAVNSRDYRGSDCFKTITLEYHGKTAEAPIVDLCPGCPPGGIDLSPALFSYFMPISQDVTYEGTWSRGTKPAPPPPSSPPPPPPPSTSSSVWTPPPTSSATPSSTVVSTASRSVSESLSTSRSMSSSAMSSSAIQSSSAARPTVDSSAADDVESGGLDSLVRAALAYANIAVAGGTPPS